MPLVKEIWATHPPRVGNVDANLPQPAGISIESQDLVGIEVEVENAVDFVGRARSFWISKSDGSLRNGGVEFVTMPIRACDAPKALYSLMTETLQTRCCFSPRTSVHVHVDFRDTTVDTATDVILLYSVFERLFYKFVGRQRIKNIYCVPLTETDLLSQLGRKGLRTDYWQKYSGLNAKPLADLGTLEFRHMHGTMNVDKLCIWIELITQLKTFCVKKGTKEIRKLLASLSDDFDFEALLVEIFGSNSVFLKYESIEDVRFTYQCAKLGCTKNAELENLSRTVTSEAPFYKLRSLT